MQYEMHTTMHSFCVDAMLRRAHLRIVAVSCGIVPCSNPLPPCGLDFCRGSAGTNFDSNVPPPSGSISAERKRSSRRPLWQNIRGGLT
jgi:hypothetical protein